MTTRERCESAIRYRKGGANCAQSLLAAFADVMGITEAQALGVPVLSTKTDGGTELIRDEETGLLCDISAEAIEDGVRRLLRDKALYDRIREGTAGIDFESRNAHVMQRLYEELECP